MMEKISKPFLNLLNRWGWGEEKPKDSEEAKFKIEWYDTYCQMLEQKNEALDECIVAYKSVMTIEDCDMVTLANAKLNIVNCRIEKYENEKELMAKNYYKENYKFRIAQQEIYNKQLSAEADERFAKLLQSAQQLLLYKANDLEPKERLILSAIAYRKEQGFITNEERNQCYKDLKDHMEKIVARLQSIPQKPQPQKVDLSK